MKTKILLVVVMMFTMSILTGFTNKGILVHDYTSNTEGRIYDFKSGQEVELDKETDWGYVVVIDKVRHQLERKNIIRTTKVSQQYVTTADTYMLNGVPGKNVKDLKTGSILQILKFEGEYGLFSDKDTTIGYVSLDKVVMTPERNITYGLTSSEFEVENEDMVFSVDEGQAVAIKDFKDGKYIVIDNNKNEFKVEKGLINISKKVEVEAPNRSVVSRGTTRTRSAVEQEVQREVISDSAAKLISEAKLHLGKRYVYATAGPNTFDCSGFTAYAYSKALGTSLQRSSMDQTKNGVSVSKANLMPGDLVFFKTTKATVGHVGIYIGDGNMIHASSTQRKVVINSITEGYYNSRYVTARRVIK